MLIDGFLTVTAVLEPHRLFLPAALPVSDSPAPPSVLAGDTLLPAGDRKMHFIAVKHLWLTLQGMETNRHVTAGPQPERTKGFLLTQIVQVRLAATCEK